MTSSDLTPPRLYARTTEVHHTGPLAALVPAEDGCAWLRRGDGMVAAGEVVRYKATTISDAETWWRELAETVVADDRLGRAVPGAGFVGFGSFAFDPANTAAQSTLIVPRVVIGRRDGVTWRTVIGTEPGEDVPWVTPPSPRRPENVRYADGALTAADWQAAVAEAVARIGTGALDKVVLARVLQATADDDIDPRWLVGRLSAGYPRCWTYAIDGLVGSTPEMLVRRDGSLVASRVLAGTIRRSGQQDQASILASALAQSSKDLDEHEYAVSSVARALAPFCRAVDVPDTPYVLDLPNVLHLATDITAAAEPGVSALALAAALHPSAAVCGTPTEVARATIAELEQFDRERYAGPVGWIDAAGDGEWAIALRCGQIEKADPRRIRLFAGCGIVAGSDPAAEMAEAGAKLVPMREALL